MNAVRTLPAIDILRTAGTVRGAYARGHLSRRARAGVLVHLAPGIYAPADQWVELGGVDQHLVLARAISENLRDGAVLGFESAALLQGIEFLGKLPPQVQLVMQRSGSRVRRFGTSTHTTTRWSDPVQVAGMWCTPPARTVIDLAAAHPFESGLVAADSALRSGLVTMDGLLEGADAHARFPGGRRVIAIVTRADGSSGSAGESLSRGRCYQLGARIPSLQKRFVVNGRTYYVDFYWEELDVVGEFDGAMKYAHVDGSANTAALIAEKEREDGIRERLRALRRWGWEDAFRVSRFERILREIGALQGPAQRLFGLKTPHRMGG